MQQLIFVYFLFVDLVLHAFYFSNLKHGVYKIRSPSMVYGYSNVYCHMTSLPGCSGGGWTLAMKINGRKVSTLVDCCCKIIHIHVKMLYFRKPFIMVQVIGATRQHTTQKEAKQALMTRKQS